MISFFHYTYHKQHTIFYPAPRFGEAVYEENKRIRKTIKMDKKN